MAEFEFLDPGPLVDGELELVLVEQSTYSPCAVRSVLGSSHYSSISLTLDRAIVR
jgi:hypothetical protein